jgi:hypothetical protein
MTCTVYQYIKSDSTNPTVAKSIDYSRNGRIVTELFNDYMGYDGIYQYYYQDTLLVKRKYAADNLDSTQTIYTYDYEGKIISEVHYRYEKRLRLDRESKGDIVSEDDYDKEKSWAKSSEIKYTYDSRDRKIEYYAPSIHWDDQNRYTWSYNESGQIKEHCSYKHDKLIWKEEYKYSGNTMSIKRTWIDSGDFSQITQKLDKNNRMPEEITLDEKGQFVNKTKHEYGDDGLIKKKATYDTDGNPITTYIYVYVKLPPHKL